MEIIQNSAVKIYADKVNSSERSSLYFEEMRMVAAGKLEDVINS